MSDTASLELQKWSPQHPHWRLRGHTESHPARGPPVPHPLATTRTRHPDGPPECLPHSRRRPYLRLRNSSTTPASSGVVLRAPAQQHPPHHPTTARMRVPSQRTPRRRSDPRPRLCCRQYARAFSSAKTFLSTHASPETRGEETTLFLDKGFWLVYQPRHSRLYISPSLLKVGLWLARTAARSGLRDHGRGNTHAHTAA